MKQKLRDRLIRIAADGELRQRELDEFESILKEAVELEKRIGELKIYALRQGINIKEIMPLAG